MKIIIFKAIVPLTSGTSISNHISQFTWEYFYFNSIEVSGTIPSFTIIVNQTTGNFNNNFKKNKSFTNSQMIL